METLVLVTHHRNQYYNQSKFNFSGHCSNLPSNELKANGCRSFACDGSFPSPSSKSNSCYKPKSPKCYSEPPKHIKRSNPIAICSKLTFKNPNLCEDLDDFSYSELFAGPAYSNSPPPSSLPLPKFPLRQKRSVSLDLPVTKSYIELKPISKSAPSSPTRESFTFATENLRRILHLNISDDD